MRIRQLEIANYRSIRHLEMQCEPMVVLLGPNNHGKSNILGALEFALTSSTKPDASDFFAHRGADEHLWVELEFDELTAQEQNTWKKYVQSDGRFRLRKTAEIAQSGKVEIAYNGYVVEPTESWLQNEAVKSLSSRDEIVQTPLGGLVPAAGRLRPRKIQSVN